jgi:branched-chain amino acid transport system substrate-binding protein
LLKNATSGDIGLKYNIILGLVLSAGFTAMASAQIKIGVAGPLTGANAAFGAQVQTGALQAVTDINAKGGLLGQKLQPVVLDDACDPKQAVSDANQFVTDGVVMVDGHFCSSASIPASQVYTENGILEISPSSTTPKYTDAGSSFTFRTCGRDDEQALVASAYIAAHFKNAKIAILDDNSTYGKGIAVLMRQNLKKLGADDVLDASYTAGDKDFSALISREKQAGVTLVYVGGYYGDYGLMMREGGSQGFAPLYFSESATANKATWQIAGAAAEGSLLTFPPPPAQNPAAAGVVAELKAQGKDPGSYLLYSYAAVQIWAEAVKKAHSTSPILVANVLKADGPWASVLGPISFDAKGDPVKINYQVYKWHDGDYKVFAAK